MSVGKSENHDAQPPKVLDDLLNFARSTLGNTSPTPRLDAEVLLAHTLGTNRSALLAHPGRPVPQDKEQLFGQLLGRRRQGEPVAYITGKREFWSLSLKVTAATLIPRPETELIVEQCLQRVPLFAHVHILELGTGSGAISLALATERPACSITATDVSAAALAVARQNAAVLKIYNVDFTCGDWFAPVAGRRFRLIASNPPYVASGDPHLKSGDIRYEPAQALIAGPDGLAAMRTIIEHAPAYLEPDGALLLEHGLGQAEAVRELMRSAGFTQIQSVTDLAGIERVCLGVCDAL